MKATPFHSKDRCQCGVLDYDGDRCLLLVDFSDGLCTHCHAHALDAARAAHHFTLLFEDEHGDLWRCSCGEQGFDFTQGQEGFAAHLAALASAEPSL